MANLRCVWQPQGETTEAVRGHPLTSPRSLSPRARSVRVRRTPGISCEAVPASEVDHRGHEAALLPRNGAAESFVSFIPLLGRPILDLDPPDPLP